MIIQQFLFHFFMAPHSSTLAWKIPWTEEPGGLQSMGSLSQTQLSNFTFTFHFHELEKETATHSSVLGWRIPGAVEPGGLPSLGSGRVGHDWSDLATAVAVAAAVWMIIFNTRDFYQFPSQYWMLHLISLHCTLTHLLSNIMGGWLIINKNSSL